VDKMGLAPIKTFPSRLMAESIGHILDSWQIPFHVSCQDFALFGMHGMPATLMVRAEDIEDAKIVLKDFLDD